MLNQMFIAQNNKGVEELILTVSPTSLNWANAQEGDTKTITITTNGNWSITNNSPESLSFDKASGKGNSSVEVEIISTPGSTTSASFTITSTLGSQTQSITVNVSLLVYTIDITGLISDNLLFDHSNPPVQDGQRTITVDTNWPSWTMSVVSTSNMGDNWRTWINFDKYNGTSSDNQITYTMNNSYFKEGTMQVKFTCMDGMGNSQEYEYTWSIKGIDLIILHMKQEEEFYVPYITDSYYTSSTRLESARDYEKQGLFYPGSYLLEEDGPTVKLYDEYGIDCSPVYTISHYIDKESLYNLLFTPVCDETTFSDPDLGGCGLRYIWRIDTSDSTLNRGSSVILPIYINYDPSDKSVSGDFSRESHDEDFYIEHYYNNGYERPDEISPTGPGAVGISWFTPYISGYAYVNTRDESRNYSSFGKVIAFQSNDSGYQGLNLILIDNWDGSLTSINTSEGTLLIPFHYHGLKANWPNTLNPFTVSNFTVVNNL